MVEGDIKIALVTSGDPCDRRTWSGVPYYAASAIGKYIGSVDYISPLSIPLQRIRLRLSDVVYGVSGKRTYPLRTRKSSLSFSKKISRKLSASKYDLIFALVASAEIAYFESDIPIVYVSDATFHQMHDVYPMFSSLTKKTVENEMFYESSALKKAGLVIYPSRWAAESAINDYGVSREKVKIIPFGANLENIPQRESVVGKKVDGKLKMLFLAKEWDRKGGAIALETLKALLEMGVNAELTVCGVRPPSGVSHKCLNVVPYLDKNVPEDRERLENIILGSHLLLLPTRIECYGIVFCEANAYGLPVFATDVGGIPSVVKNGENGYLLPLEAGGKDYAEIIAGTIRDDDAYSKLNEGARDRYDEALNWDTWGISVRQAIKDVIGI